MRHAIRLRMRFSMEKRSRWKDARASLEGHCPKRDKTLCPKSGGGFCPKTLGKPGKETRQIG